MNRAGPQRIAISVVVTCYNYAQYVAEAVDSALAQSHPAAQVIVVDDGSTDGSTELLRARYGADSRVILICVENGGQLAAFQHGLAQASGDIVAFLDADDRWSRDYLEKLAALYGTRGDVDFVFSDIDLFGEEAGVAGYADRAMDLGYTIVSTFMLAHWYGAPTSALSMRAAWARRATALPADMLPLYRIGADVCLVLGAGVLGARKYYLPTGSVQYRVHGKNSGYRRVDAATLLKDRMRRRCIVRTLAARIGLSEWCLEDAKYEFRTKPNPSWREARRYAGLCLRCPTDRIKNLERALSILLRAWRNRRTAPREARVPP